MMYPWVRLIWIDWLMLVWLLVLVGIFVASGSWMALILALYLGRDSFARRFGWSAVEAFSVDEDHRWELWDYLDKIERGMKKVVISRNAAGVLVHREGGWNT